MKSIIPFLDTHLVSAEAKVYNFCGWSSTSQLLFTYHCHIHSNAVLSWNIACFNMVTAKRYFYSLSETEFIASAGFSTARPAISRMKEIDDAKCNEI